MLMSVSFVAGCSNYSTEEKNASTANSAETPVAAPTINAPANNNTSTVSVPVVSPSAATPQLNPAHGKPGHRCDIAVGAPLDSKPATNTANTIQPAAPTANSGLTITPSTPTQGTFTEVPDKTTVPAITPAEGLNPAHGQPGHRCDIAVGAPLNSKPASQPATISQEAPLLPSDEIKPTPLVKPVNAENAKTTAPGMNPAHGQPGHRCDIAVGAPLNSKPSPVNKEKN